jgi:hypothetical protein
MAGFAPAIFAFAQCLLGCQINKARRSTFAGNVKNCFLSSSHVVRRTSTQALQSIIANVPIDRRDCSLLGRIAGVCRRYCRSA